MIQDGDKLKLDYILLTKHMRWKIRKKYYLKFDPLYSFVLWVKKYTTIDIMTLIYD